MNQKKMTLKIIKKPLKIKKIEFAPSDKVYKNKKFVNQFMKKIFGATGFLLTDESSIYDFDFQLTSLKVSHSTQKYLDKIEEVYGIDVSKVKGLILYKIFDLIQKT